MGRSLTRSPGYHLDMTGYCLDVVYCSEDKATLCLNGGEDFNVTTGDYIPFGPYGLEVEKLTRHDVTFELITDVKERARTDQTHEVFTVGKNKTHKTPCGHKIHVVTCDPLRVTLRFNDGDHVRLALGQHHHIGQNRVEVRDATHNDVHFSYIRVPEVLEMSA